MRNTKRLVTDGILTAAALAIFVAEAQLPPIVPVPGIKLGLANIITLFALLNLSAADTFMILTARIILSAFAFSGPSVLLYSFTGGMGCLCAEFFLLKLCKEKQIWAVSAVGGIVHNIFQLAAAAAVTMTASLFLYAPAMILFGLVTGLFNGLCVRFANDKIKRFF